ncbi:MAG: FtsX-like permease family protein [Gemmatimonadetes bacterium]|jgi:lipoprotein-releasing system permease protein|nr:FtsX-like permease family protein [Gemmatimonadota bacterium]MBT7861948.1 FtsX-like permease family protein [Gemmatimonadota bacterium]
MSFELFVARRYLQSKQSSGFLSVITVIAVGGVILGVAALIIMLSVTNGFSGEVKSRLIGMDAHVTIQRYYDRPIEDPAALMESLRDYDIATMAPVIKGKVILVTPDDEMDGVFVWGIDPESFSEVSDLPAHLKWDRQKEFHLSPENDSKPGIVLGGNLANRLRVGLGDTIYLVTFGNQSLEDMMMGGMSPKIHPFVVTDVFESGMYLYDDGFAFIGLEQARDLMRIDGEGATAIHMRIDDLDEATVLREQLTRDFGYPYTASDWTQQYPELFRWMELEKWVIFIALSLIIVVAAFNIMSILSMSILIKTPEIGILRTMGARARGIARVFVLQGLFIGCFGTSLGCGLGLLVCTLQDRFQIISIPSDIYIISSLPVDMQASDFLLVSSISILICFLAAILPARRAASLQPVEAIRYIM